MVDVAAAVIVVVALHDGIDVGVVAVAVAVIGVG